MLRHAKSTQKTEQSFREMLPFKAQQLNISLKLNVAIQAMVCVVPQRGEDKERGSARGRTLGRGEISDEGALLPFPYGASPRIRAPRPAEFNIGQKDQARGAPAGDFLRAGSARWHFPSGAVGEALPAVTVHAAVRGF